MNNSKVHELLIRSCRDQKIVERCLKELNTKANNKAFAMNKIIPQE